MKYCELFHHNVDWTQHEVSFGVWENGICRGLLRLIPLGCEISEQRDNPDAPCNGAYGIYTQVKIETEGFNCMTMDFFDPQSYKDLYLLLSRDKTMATDAVEFSGDGLVEINFRWREEGDLSVIGYLPASWHDSFDHLLARDPSLLRNFIKTNVKFEFLVPSDQMDDPCGELERLLSHVRSVEEKASL